MSKGNAGAVARALGISRQAFAKGVKRGRVKGPDAAGLYDIEASVTAWGQNVRRGQNPSGVARPTAADPDATILADHIPLKASWVIETAMTMATAAAALEGLPRDTALRLGNVAGIAMMEAIEGMIGVGITIDIAVADRREACLDWAKLYPAGGSPRTGIHEEANHG